MSQVKPNDFPIEPKITSGNELAYILNRLFLSIQSNQFDSARPKNISAGGIWTKSSSDQITLYLFDGIDDIEIGHVKKGEKSLSIPLTGEYISKALINVELSDVNGSVRSIPQNIKTSAYTLVASDNGKHISITNGGVTIPARVFTAGQVVTIYNNSNLSQVLTEGNGLTLRWAGQTSEATGNRTLELYGLATVLYISPSLAVISGAGVN